MLLCNVEILKAFMIFLSLVNFNYDNKDIMYAGQGAVQTVRSCYFLIYVSLYRTCSSTETTANIFYTWVYFTDGLGATESLFAGVILGGNDPIPRDTDGKSVARVKQVYDHVNSRCSLKMVIQTSLEIQMVSRLLG